MAPISQQETPAAELLEALHDLLETAATQPRAAQPARLERAVRRWSRDLATPADAVALVALARPELATTPLRVELLDAVTLLAVSAIADRQVSEALVDPLTGLSTRARMADELEHLLALSRRTNSPLTAVLLDVDGLKQINDLQGHAAGDAALAEVGRAVRAHLRQADRAYRWGGDEFVLFLSGTTEAEAQLVLDRIQSSCATSTSAGLALHTDGTTDVELAAWLSQADADLYRRRRAAREAASSRRIRFGGARHAALLSLLAVGAAMVGWTGATVAGVTDASSSPVPPAQVQAVPRVTPPTGGLAPAPVGAPVRMITTVRLVPVAAAPVAAPAVAPTRPAQVVPATEVVPPVGVTEVVVPTIPAAPLPSQGVKGVLESVVDTVQGVVSAVL